MHERLKRIIFKKLDQDLGHAEIIVDDNKSIWFIDRANKYWYLELRSSGTLWWRYTFFNDFFPLFGMVREEYEPVIAEWVEEVLKRGVSSTILRSINRTTPVEEVLKRGVSSTLTDILMELRTMEEVLKCNVSSTFGSKTANILGVKEVLKREVYSTQCNVGLQGSRPVEEVLESKAPPTTVDNLSAVVTMKKVLSLKAGVRECKMKIKKIFKKFTS
jgi:hypothetical protein